MSLSLGYPSRPLKPRRNGRIALIDPGLPLGLFADTLNTHHPYIDAVKFGWACAPLLHCRDAGLGAMSDSFKQNGCRVLSRRAGEAHAADRLK